MNMNMNTEILNMSKLEKLMIESHGVTVIPDAADLILILKNH